MIKNGTFLFISCEEAAKCCNKGQYNDASLVEKFQLVMHLLICKPCRKYTAVNTKLTRLLNKADIESCDEKDKSAWREEINRKISENNL